MRKFLSVLVLLIAAGGWWMTNTKTDINALPPLKSGDLIFDTTITNQTVATILATGSIYTHVGIVHKDGENITVLQAAQKVVESPLEEFIHSGWGQHITIKRYKGLTDEDRQAIVKNAQSYLGRPYNYIFYMPSKEIYCSELAYLSFNTQHIPLGDLQKISDLNVNNPAVKRLFKERWHMHPACQEEGMSYEQCWEAVLKEPIITPGRLASDSHLTTLYSNYFF